MKNLWVKFDPMAALGLLEILNASDRIYRAHMKQKIGEMACPVISFLALWHMGSSEFFTIFS